jgi:DNA-binding NarL/FixJ family response regulator
MSVDGVSPGGAMRLLLVDAARTLAPSLADAMGAEFSDAPIVVDVTAGRLALDLLRSSEFDVVAADLEALADLGDRAEDRIGKLVRASQDALVIVLSQDCSISSSLATMRAGAHDCVGREAGGRTIVARIGELARRHGRRRALTQTAAASVQAVAAPAPTIPAMRDLVLPMWRQEQRIIENAIQSFAGNIALAAAALELSPSTIYRKRQAWADLAQRQGELARVIGR